MSGSHTPASARHHHDDDVGLRLARPSIEGQPEQFAGAIDGHLATFPAHVRKGLLDASTAVGLEVMAEMMLGGLVGRAMAQSSAEPCGPDGGTCPDSEDSIRVMAPCEEEPVGEETPPEEEPSEVEGELIIDTDPPEAEPVADDEGAVEAEGIRTQRASCPGGRSWRAPALRHGCSASSGHC